ncbi:MAG: DGQHR domain-containing protein [Ferruginibacter sp.]
MSNQSDLQYTDLSCLEIVQPIGTFYLGVMNYDELEYISFVDVRRLQKNDRDVEEYIGIQRPLNEGRVNEIGKYVNLIDATFPSTVILSIRSEDVEYDKKSKILKIVRKQNAAKVLDGQHRIAGLNKCELAGGSFQIPVTIFIDMEIEDQALVFSTINKTHTKVNKSLPYDLFEFAKTRSPQRTGHTIARALNQKGGSPFKDKIKILGVADDKEKETITQATFVESLLDLITKDKMTDRDLYRRDKIPNEYIGKDHLKYCLRPLFLLEQDGKIAQIVWNYFKAVQHKWPNSWNKVEASKILNRSTGFIVLMKFLGDCLRSINNFNEVPEVQVFITIFDKVTITDEAFTRDNYLPGSGGQSKLYGELKDMTKIGI